MLLEKHEFVYIALLKENIPETFYFVPSERAFRKQFRQVAVTEKLSLFIKDQVNVSLNDLRKISLYEMLMPIRSCVAYHCYAFTNINAVNNILAVSEINRFSDK